MLLALAAGVVDADKKSPAHFVLSYGLSGLVMHSRRKQR
jgi:hypothetical protein